MNQVYLNCQELQRFLERQWQRLRGVITVDVETKHALVVLEESRDNVEKATNSIRKKPALEKGSMDVIVEGSSVADSVSIIDDICETLTSLLDAGNGYRKYYVLLLEALLKLLTTLKDVEKRQPEMLRSSGIFGQLKVSVSITYALVEKVSARLQLLILVAKFRRFTCTTPDSMPKELKARVTETKRLLDEIVYSLKTHDQGNISLRFDAFTAGASSYEMTAAYGINKLVIAAHHRSSLLENGEKITFPVRDSHNRVVYTVQTWLNNPNSLFKSAKRLSASVDCASGRVFNIGVPGYPNKEVDPQNRTALIISGFEQAQVRSFLPEDGTNRFRSPSRKAGCLLEQNQPSSGSYKSCPKRQQKYAGELLLHSRPRYQKYRGDIVMSNMTLKLDCIGKTHEVRRLSVEGKKHKTRVWYKCSVEVTGEVVAIYRQRRRNHKGRKDEGVFHLLGVGNQPELRDLIVCSFVAMGLNSFL